MPNLQQAAEQFDQWMKKYEKSHRERGHFEDNNKALLSFLNGDRGFEHIKTYEEFCELSELVELMCYKTTNPPCSPIDFARAIENAHPKSFCGEKPLIPAEVAETLLQEQLQENERMDEWIRSEVARIQQISDRDERIGETLALGMLAHGLFKVEKELKKNVSSNSNVLP